jgi:hypothetical protein
MTASCSRDSASSASSFDRRTSTAERRAVCASCCGENAIARPQQVLAAPDLLERDGVRRLLLCRRPHALGEGDERVEAVVLGALRLLSSGRQGGSQLAVPPQDTPRVKWRSQEARRRFAVVAEQSRVERKVADGRLRGGLRRCHRRHRRGAACEDARGHALRLHGGRRAATGARAAATRGRPLLHQRARIDGELERDFLLLHLLLRRRLA